MNDYLKILPHYLMPKSALTQFAGFMAEIKIPYIKNQLIRYFLSKYQGVKMQEAEEENPLNYSCFNEFFLRKLKPEKRPIAPSPIVSPVDGVVSQIGLIKKGQIIQAKGHYYNVEELLACNDSQAFKEGCFATFYLSPTDYHRIHMPLSGTLKKMIYVPGKFFSVQPLTTRLIPNLFARNERAVAFFETEIGLMVMVLVGATLVGSIGTSWGGDIKKDKKIIVSTYANEKIIHLQKGDEMGYFKLGSTVILLFADSKKVNWSEKIHDGGRIQYGQTLAV